MTTTTRTTTLNNTLILEMRGCDFRENDEANKFSDIGNFRVGCYKNRIKAKNGKEYILEFGEYDRYEYRKTNKRTGKPLKHEIRELAQKNALNISTCFETKEKGYYGDIFSVCHLDANLEHDTRKKHYNYDKKSILEIVNKISIKQYDNILLVCDISILDHFKHIRSIAGMREKDILNNLERVKRIEYTNDHYVVSFVSYNGYSFSYDLVTKKICG